MGFSLRKKKRTSVEKKSLAITESKIIKLSYLQTLAISGGLTNVSNLGLETEATPETQVDFKNNTKKNFVTTQVDALNKNISKNPIPLLDPLFAGTSVVANIVKGLFGKKVSVDTKVTTTDTGWNIVKTWNQPQFDIIRYALGIKELEVSQFKYKQTSEFISIPWSSPKEIQKINLYVDQFIPSEFPPGDSYIKYYIKIEEQNSSWIQINPISLPTIFNENGTIVPRIITFNTEKPVSSKLEEAYVYSTNPVKTIRFRAVFSRPDTITNSEVSADAYTPILKSYKLIMTPKDGL